MLLASKPLNTISTKWLFIVSHDVIYKSGDFNRFSIVPPLFYTITLLFPDEDYHLIILFEVRQVGSLP